MYVRVELIDANNMADIEEELLLQANLFLLLVLKRRHRQPQNQRKHRFWIRKIFTKRQELRNFLSTVILFDVSIYEIIHIFELRS